MKIILYAEVSLIHESISAKALCVIYRAQYLPLPIYYSSSSVPTPVEIFKGAGMQGMKSPGLIKAIGTISQSVDSGISSVLIMLW
jgi:hypothetical protein